MENINNLKSVKNIYEQGRRNQRGLSHGYNILTGEIFNQNLSQKKEENSNYLNSMSNYNIISNEPINYRNINPRKTTNPNLQYNNQLLNYGNNGLNDLNKPLSEEEYKNFNKYIEKLNNNNNNNNQKLTLNENENNENIPLYKQYPAGFNPKNHPDMFNKQQINNNVITNQNYQNNKINNNNQINQYYNNYYPENLTSNNNNFNNKNIKDDPFDNSAYAKAKRQREYKESLDYQINRKKEYYNQSDVSYNQAYKNNRKKFDDMEFNPYTQKKYSIGEMSSLPSNPLTNNCDYYNFKDNRRFGE